MINPPDSVEKAELETMMFTCWENLWISQRKMQKSRFYGNRKYFEMQGTSQGALMVKNPPAYAGHVREEGLIPKLGRSPGGGNGNLLQYSCLENPHGQRSLKGYSPWGHKESDMTERLSLTHWLTQFHQTQNPAFIWTRVTWTLLVLWGSFLL